MKLPRDVQPVTNRHGRSYYYFTPGRGTKNPGKRVPLGTDTNDPEFWRRLRDAKNWPGADAGSFATLIASYKSSPDWKTFGRRQSQQDRSRGRRPSCCSTDPA